MDLRCGLAIDAFGRAARGQRYLVDSEGRELGPHDLVVVADGARSHLRDGASQHKSATPYPWGALWFIGKDPENFFGGELHQIVEGPQRMLGFLPTGLGPGDGATPLVSLFWSLRADLFPQWQRDGLGAWKDVIRGYAPHAEPLLEQIVDPQQITFAGYHDVVMDPWNTRNVVFIGDAAHATSPQLGQGCNLALYDAMILSDCVSELPFLPSALDEYSRRRKDHLAFYQFATRWLTPFFQSDYDLLGTLRDVLMGPMCRIPFVRREMVRSMTGTKAGML
ncbi:MAG: NAD(P)/FAD-dependent oxidoreductase, partial [Polyangiaceae bacterium]